ncbi:MAG TPA: VWA domain-containing protein [Isosphaeraceae bacterium]|jgi:Ca-activated chloride channel family protein|nr:VWA domain-containing protein [Isosphaeraceae bacterium]
MTAPSVELIPRKPAVCSEAAITLDVLVRITPPMPEVHFPRPPLNLALVLDRSGSMAGAKKMPYAREAAAFAVRQLLPTDRVSVTTFDDRVEPVVPSVLAADKSGIVRTIEQIQPRGSTDLHGGWAEGARQAESHLVAGALNRVLLLSDGLANHGVTDPNAIAAEARGLAARGISTTTLGVGDDYNEDLLEAMAKAGDGNYCYIQAPVQLADIFQTELRGLMATLGQKVSLGVEPAAGVAVADVLNDLERAPTGRLMLPNLVVGMPISVVVRLNVPADAGADGWPLGVVRLAWDDGGTRRTLHASLAPLPAVPRVAWEALPDDPTVAEHEALLMAARAQREAAHALERGDVAMTRMALGRARGLMDCFASPAALDELAALDLIEGALDAGANLQMIKHAKYRAYKRHQSRPTPPEPPTS